MQRHLVLTTDSEFRAIISGKIQCIIRFFKKRQEFLGRVKSGDLVFLKVKKEILGQFLIGKMVLVEKIGDEDFSFIKNLKGLENNLHEDSFKKSVDRNSIVLIAQIDKLEQLITSPIDVPQVRKDWVILEEI